MSRALVVVDYQNDFVKGSLGSSSAQKIEENIISKIQEYLMNGDKIFFTMDTHGNDYLETDEGAHIPFEHCIRGTDGWRLFGKVADHQHEGRTIEKRTFGSLELIDEVKGFDEIELCGVATNICVIANAVILKTANPESEIIIDRKCVASYDDDLHDKALDVMRSLSIVINDGA